MTGENDRRGKIWPLVFLVNLSLCRLGVMDEWVNGCKVKVSLRKLSKADYL